MESINSAFDLIGRGGLLMAPIVICSLIALTIIFERLYFFFKTYENPEAIFDSIEKMLAKGKGLSARDIPVKPDGPIARLLKVGMDEKNAPQWKLEEKLSVTGQEEINSFSKNIRWLEVIATISPLLGLLGTVTGMVRAFNKVAEYKGQVDPSLLAGGIWEALLTTAAGLAVAIPVVIMLHYFEKKIETISFHMEKFAKFLVHQIHGEQEAQANGSGLHSTQHVQPVQKTRTVA